jgi:uncharacterized protein GlcG (DUF336 family)
MSITLAEAQKAIEASVAKAKELGVAVAVAVLDDQARIVAVARMDGSRFLFLPEAAQGKAMATVLWGGQHSGALQERAVMPIMDAVKEMYGGKVIYQQGAVAVKRGDAVIGAVGAGGASGQQDEDIAAAGAAAIS